MQDIQKFSTILLFAILSINTLKAGDCLSFCPSSADISSSINPCPLEPAYGGDVPRVYATLYDAEPQVCKGIDFFITADFIWWTAREDNLTYARNGINSDIGPGLIYQEDAKKGREKFPDWNWNPGFKIGLGKNLSHDQWDIYFEYTWLYSKADKTSIKRPLDTLDSIFAGWQVGGFVNFIF